MDNSSNKEINQNIPESLAPVPEPTLIAASEQMQAEAMSVTDPHYLEARTDALTSLPNRLWLEEQLPNYIQEQPGNFFLAFVDLDGLKHINDTQGHTAGDELIQRAGQSMQESLRTAHDERPADAVHLSGDEFVILAPNVSDQETADMIMERLADNLRQNGVTASMGGKVHETGETGAMLLTAAEKQMYAQKETHKQERLAALPRRKQAAAYAAKLLNKYAGVTTR